MKLETLQIRWHGQEPVFAADFHASGRLATGGADKSVKIWMVTERPASLLDSGTSDGATAAAVAPSSSISSSALATSGASSKEREREQRQRVGMRAGIEIEFLAELSRHTQSVNCVRFSPDGAFLASSADDGAIVIWRLTPEKPISGLEGEAEYQKESWSVYRTLLHHRKDVYDICWSPCSELLFSCSTDCTCVMWNVLTGTLEKQVTDHHNYVQGVACDPLYEYFVSQSNDRSCRVYSLVHSGPSSANQQASTTVTGTASLTTGTTTTTLESSTTPTPTPTTGTAADGVAVEDQEENEDNDAEDNDTDNGATSANDDANEAAHTGSNVSSSPSKASNLSNRRDKVRLGRCMVLETLELDEATRAKKRLAKQFKLAAQFDGNTGATATTTTTTLDGAGRGGGDDESDASDDDDADDEMDDDDDEGVDGSRSPRKRRVAATRPKARGSRTKLFLGTSLQSFFRRCAWSPDGQYLATPAGMSVQYEPVYGESEADDAESMDVERESTQQPRQQAAQPLQEPTASADAAHTRAPSTEPVGYRPVFTNCSHVWSRSSMARPIVMLPSCEQPSVVCRWSPVLYELRNKPADADADADSATTTARNKPRGFDRAPYRMLLAIGTLSSVMIYDTEQLYPIVYLSKLHYSSLTDLAWSRDGRWLVITSTDGYCTIVSFDEGELGSVSNISPPESGITARRRAKAAKEASNPPKKPAAPAAAIPSVPTATATTASSQKETLVVVGGQGGATKRRITPVAIPIDE